MDNFLLVEINHLQLELSRIETLILVGAEDEYNLINPVTISLLRNTTHLDIVLKFLDLSGIEYSETFSSLVDVKKPL